MSISAAGSALGVLGLGPTAEAVYRVALRHPRASLDELADMAGTSTAELRRGLAPLAAAGLLTVDGDDVDVVPPDRALGRLVAAESSRLESASSQLEALRRQLPSLMADYLSSEAERGEPVRVEVVEGGDLFGHVRSLAATSTGELLWLRPDQWRIPGSSDVDDWVREILRSGRRSRAIYPARVLEEAPHVVRRRAEAGEQVRVLATVPARMAVLGGTAAVVHERWGVNTGRRLVIRQQSLVGALTLLFENLWERAMSVPGLHGPDDDRAMAGERRLLLDQLAHGAKDEHIARAMNLSLRTVRRRVAALLAELGASSRFEAGAEAVRRGWI